MTFCVPKLPLAPPSFWYSRRAHSSAQLEDQSLALVPAVRDVAPQVLDEKVTFDVIFVVCAVVAPTWVEVSALVPSLGDSLPPSAGPLAALAELPMNTMKFFWQPVPRIDVL